MPLYKYFAVNGRGESIEGTFVSGDRSQLLQMIREKQFYPVAIKEITQGKDVGALVGSGKAKTKDIAVFCRQFYTMLNAGVTIVKALDILQEQTESKKFKAVIKEVYEDVQKGASLSESLTKRSNTFPELFINMVEAGELSGNLDVIMDQMASLYEKENKINNKIKGAMVYPIILIIVAVVVVTFLLTFVMPTFIGMFESSGVKLPLPTRMLIGLSHFIRKFWYVILSGIAATVYAVHKYISTENGRLSWDRLKLRLPIVKGTVVKIITARFTRTLSTLLVSGIPLLQAMEVTAKVVGNRVVADGLMTAREDMRQGKDLAGPIHRIGVFPPMVDNMIFIGEESGALDDILEKTANFYDEEVEVALQKMITMMEPMLILVMGVVVGFIVISIALPMFDMMQTIK